MAKDRCLRACTRCRNMKVRCSGTFPCSRCARKKRECRFATDEGRVSVSESYIRELERRAKEIEDDAAGSRPRPRELPRDPENVTPAVDSSVRAQESVVTAIASSEAVNTSPNPTGVNEPVNEEGSDALFSRNPLADADAETTFVQHPDGRYWYMGPTSSWSFCRRVLSMIDRHIPDTGNPPDPWNLDGVAFKLDWQRLGPNEEPSVDDLPSHEYATLLFNTFKYHLGYFSGIIDERYFLGCLNEFYQQPRLVVSRSRQWFAQYLLVLAFGEAFVNPSTSEFGSQYASRAIPLLPDLHFLDKDPLSGIESLCLAALYLHSIDLRITAFHHIGHALHLSIFEGIHRHQPAEVVGQHRSLRCNRIFWIVYVLELEFSALGGAMGSIRDTDITTKMPSEMEKTLYSEAMDLQISISRLVSTILTTVYGVGDGSSGPLSLIKKIQSVLHKLAGISQELNSFLGARFQGTSSRTSKVASRLILSYHRCVVLTTRPLVMCILQSRLAHRHSGSSWNTVGSLLNTSVDSATSVIKTLRGLGDHNLLDSFLPFQLEDVFSSAFLLHIISAVTPSLVPDQTWTVNAHEVLDLMIAKGSPAARLRKLELEHLQKLISPIVEASGQGEPSRSNANDRSPAANVGNADDLLSAAEDGVSPWDLLGADGMHALSPQQILGFANEFDMDSVIQSMFA